MMISLSGSAPAVQPQVAAPAPQPAAAPAASRATQPDTVSISAQGHQMAAQSSDGDADAS